MTEAPAPELLSIDGLEVRVTRSCARRDLYELRLGRRLPLSLRTKMTELGVATGNDVLWIVDVAGAHRITVAAATGRIVVLPRMEPERSSQRAAAIAFTRWLASELAACDVDPAPAP